MGKTAEQGKVEFKLRREETISELSQEEAIALTAKIVEEEGTGI